MNGFARAYSLAVAALLLAACGPDPVPLEARVNYKTCVGAEGTCSGDRCCANQVDHTLGDTAVVECEIRAGSLPSTLRLNFSVRSPTAEGQPEIWGEDLQFNEGASNPQPLRGCTEFGIAENGNDYPSDVCDRLDVRETEYGGGGCEVQAHVNASDEVRGAFQCKELRLPAEELYLSTIYNGAVGFGEFVITGCDFRN